MTILMDDHTYVEFSNNLFVLIYICFCSLIMGQLDILDRAPDKVHKLTSILSPCVISSPNSMFDHWLESSHGDDSN